MTAVGRSHGECIRWAVEAWRWHYRVWFYPLTRERTERIVQIRREQGKRAANHKRTSR